MYCAMAYSKFQFHWSLNLSVTVPLLFTASRAGTAHCITIGSGSKVDTCT
jgi:hypothetical protein